MAVTINVNDLTLCHRGSDGVSRNTLPDVCKTPGNGVPLPYQNEAHSADLVKGTVSVHADGGHSIANFGSQFARSVFDEAGSMGGVASGTHLAETDWISHSFDVFFEGNPACRLTDKLFMNHRNTVNLAGLKQRDLPPDDQKFFDELCEMACDCWNKHKPGGPEPLTTGQTYQDCVKKQIDKKYYDGRYPKSDSPLWREVPYSRANDWEMIGSKADTNVPTSNYIRPDSRRPDIVRMGEDGKPSKIFDMKFGKDPLDAKAKREYEDIAQRHTGDPENFEEFRVNDRCDCDDNEPPQNPAPVTVPAPQKKGLLDKFGEALESSTGLKLTGAALVAALVVSEVTRLFPPRNLVPVP
ncbi:MAG: DUF4150 domain-containing protein [Burkholderiales bacterium]|nr:DUF4150 domain-containing protein [Burkholderiales bacterium]MDE1926270.1 DUF4150 domain-containing protein [Burkholderiales bacterium]MDE2157440.1 DUF4150 domain-containing protein [Burkholderiales bacterium]MDE2502601.1 DUF4150 domain-containing protein [Burkholderiales bacterium]